MKTDLVYLQQMLDAADKVLRFTAGMSKEEFLKSEVTTSAAILQLMLLGELSKKLSSETKDSMPLPWPKIAGFRNRAIHEYLDVSLDIVWETITADIPALKAELAKFD